MICQRVETNTFVTLKTHLFGAERFIAQLPNEFETKSEEGQGSYFDQGIAENKPKRQTNNFLYSYRK